MNAWTTPVVQRIDGELIVIEPPELAGRRMVQGVDAQPCLEPAPDGYGFCGLVRNHRGAHWNCSRELIDEGGTFVVIREGRS